MYEPAKTFQSMQECMNTVKNLTITNSILDALFASFICFLTKPDLEAMDRALLNHIITFHFHHLKLPALLHIFILLMNSETLDELQIQSQELFIEKLSSTNLKHFPHDVYHFVCANLNSQLSI